MVLMTLTGARPIDLWPNASPRVARREPGASPAQPHHRRPGRSGRKCRRLRPGSGVTAIVFEEPAVASIDVRGGGPGTRKSTLLDPATTVPAIDAIVLSGGSAFGLDAASGTHAWLREHGRGFAIRDALVPIVPAAILFDLLNGGDKKWGRYPPYRDLGYAAADAAAPDFALGSVGAGTGATVVDLKGGLGSASMTTPQGHVVGAIAAANAVGSTVVGGGPWFWAAPFEVGTEFGGRGLPFPMPPAALDAHMKGVSNENRPCRVATDAILTKTQAHRLAVMAQTGFARAIYPVHTPLAPASASHRARQIRRRW